MKAALFRCDFKVENNKYAVMSFKYAVAQFVLDIYEKARSLGKDYFDDEKNQSSKCYITHAYGDDCIVKYFLKIRSLDRPLLGEVHARAEFDIIGIEVIQ